MRLIDADALTEFLKCLLPERGMWEIEGDTGKNTVCETVAEAIEMVKNMETIQPEKAQLSKESTTSDKPVATDTNVGNKISKFIDGLEKTFAYIREREGGDSVCGLCEYDGAYIGESGDWCNECPGFNRNDCFKLSDKTRKEWTEEIIKALPTIQPERKDALEKAVAVEAICDELMSRFDVSATYGYDFAEAVINRIEAMAKELERGEQE